MRGWPQAAPYDAILIDGAVEELPAALAGQLKDGGRLVCVLGASPGACAMIFYRRATISGGPHTFDAAAPAAGGLRQAAGFCILKWSRPSSQSRKSSIARLFRPEAIVGVLEQLTRLSIQADLWVSLRFCVTEPFGYFECSRCAFGCGQFAARLGRPSVAMLGCLATTVSPTAARADTLEQALVDAY